MMSSSQPITEPCRACGRQSFQPWGVRDSLPLYECQTCGLVFFWPYPTQRELDAFYNQQYHERRGYDGASTRAGELRRKMYDLDVAELEHVIEPGGRFLDVGCAEGVFLTCLSPKWERHGIDVSHQAIAKAKEKPGIVASVAHISEVEEGAFRVVHLRGVFEHILDPSEFFEETRRKLTQDGFLVISNTPNVAGPVPRLFRGRYRLVLPNEHVNYFSPRSVRALAQRHGFTVRRITFPYFGTPYCSFVRDLISIPTNYLTKRPSPPFWGNILTAYLKVQS